MFIISPENPIYQEAISRELYFWSHKRVMDDKERVSYPTSHPLVSSYLNSLITGSSNQDWIDLLTSRFSPSGCAASLGSGIGFFESRLLQKNAIEQIDLYELCPENLKRARERLKPLDCKISYFDVDLNFAELPPTSYDLILSRFFLHHIVNLEHLLYQINRALKPNGIFVLYDYIGENRYRWSNNKKLFINALLDELSSLDIVTFYLGGHPGNDLIAPDDPNYFSSILLNSPFETIRSQEIPRVIESVFGDARLHEVRYGSILHAAFRSFDFSDWENQNLIYALQTFIALDQVASKQMLFNPCGLFGIYGKTLEREIECQPWSEDKIKQELSLV